MNAQQLRNSILQEAIEGRLVPQDPIHTKRIYEKDEAEMQRWNEMMNRLLAKDRHGI
jgi:hypothetical protein